MIDPGLAEAVAIVTGINNPRGIGAAVARALAREGVAVLGTYFRATAPPDATSVDTAAAAMEPGEALYRRLSAADATPVVDAIRASGDRIEAMEADLAEPAAASRIFDAAEATFGPVTILVNNAAFSEPDSLLPAEMNEGAPSAGGILIGAFTADTHDRHFHVNVRAPALLMREFARRHRARTGSGAPAPGRIVNISTDAADAFPTEVSYGASKHALESLTRSAAMEFGPLGITVNALSPGPIQSGYIPASAEPRIIRDTPLGRVGTPEDVADVVVFLASTQARWVTGQLLYVGGGHAMPR